MANNLVMVGYMDSIYTLLIIGIGINFLVYILLGSILGILFYYVMGRNFFGGIYGAIVVGILGGILGGTFLKIILIPVTDYFYKVFTIDLLSTFIGVLILLWIYKVLSQEIKKH